MISKPRPLDSFAEGYSVKRGVLSRSECARFLTAAASAQCPLDWHKGHAASSRAFYEIAAHPKIVDLVGELLGESVMIWGASIVEKAPGAIHPWHTDIESANCAGRSISVWLGLENTTQASALTIVSRSHTFGVTVQAERARFGKDRNSTTNIDVLRWAQSHDAGAELLQLDLADGDAVLFDGALWHSSNNLSDKTRRALLLQYATPDTPVRIPDLTQLDWPFRHAEGPQPPCVLVSGTNAIDVNRFVKPPAKEIDNGRSAAA
jgi:ectoine hydroxylase-related dioxygenase (phytanoyl-CoA dioxygenase family)